MHRVARALPAALIALVALPAAGHAATYTVAPGQSAAAAASAAQPGDTILFKPGTYAESIEIAKENVAVRGEPGAMLTGNPGASGATPTLAFGAAGGSVAGLLVVNLVTTGAAVAGTGTLSVADATVVGVKGPAVAIAGAAGSSSVQRAMLAGTDAVSIASGAAGAKALTIDSTVLLGTLAGVRAASAGGPGTAVTGKPGAMSIAARHITMSGAKTPFALDASAPATAAGGDIAVSVTDSIALGATATSRAARQVPALPPLAPPTTNTPLDQLTGALADLVGGGAPGTGAGTAGAATISIARTLTSGSPNTLFANPARFNYHLRADAPVIGKGGMTAGESATDLDGQPRSAGGVSDLGADQFVNGAPSAAVSAGQVGREGRPLTLDASKSADPEAAIGGGIASYRWDFGDGDTQTTTTPTVQHTYAKRGSYTASVTVVDRQGAVSQPGTTTVQVADGTAPTFTVGTPQAKQKIKLKKKNKRGKRVRRAIVLSGAAADESGIAAVSVALRLTRKAKDGRCFFYDGKSSFKARSCAKPTLLKAKLGTGTWTLKLPAKAKLKPGGYELLGAAVDKTGMPSAGRVVTFKFV